jgi:hypothetical protein
MNTTTVTINGQDFTIDLDKAKALGLLQERQPITSLAIGDVFESDGGLIRVLIIDAFYDGSDNINRFQIAGLDGLEPYSDFEELLNMADMLDWLNDRKYKFVKNINDKINELIWEK